MVERYVSARPLARRDNPMTKSEGELDALRRALDYDWPEIQKHLIEEAAKEHGEDVDPYEPYWTADSDGNRTLHASPDAWWLKHFDRKDVIMELPGVVIMNTKPWHAKDAACAFRDAYGIPQHADFDDCFTQDDIEAHIERFPQGQFIAMRISGPSAGHAIAMAVTMRTSRPPTAPVLPWMAAIGDLRLGNHDADGDWLYGVEMAVYQMYQGHGIGTGMYEARFDLVRQLNLRGWYMVGMLMGYRKHAEEMDVVEYGNKVIAREIKDPTVTMQMNRGFRPERVITDYVDESAAGNAGVLMLWDNPDFDPDRTT